MIFTDGKLTINGEKVGDVRDMSLSVDSDLGTKESLQTVSCDVCGKEVPAATANYVGSTIPEHAGVFCSDEHTPHKHVFGRYR